MNLYGPSNYFYYISLNKMFKSYQNKISIYMLLLKHYFRLSLKKDFPCFLFKQQKKLLAGLSFFVQFANFMSMFISYNFFKLFITMISTKNIFRPWFLCILITFSFSITYGQVVANITMNPKADLISAQEPFGALELSYIDDDSTNFRVVYFDEETQTVHDFNKVYDGKIIVLGRSSNQDCILVANMKFPANSGQTNQTSQNNQTNSNNQTNNYTNQTDQANFTDSNQTYQTSNSNQTNQTGYKIFLIKNNFLKKTITQIKDIPYGNFSFNNSRFHVAKQCKAYSIDQMIYMLASQNTYQQVQSEANGLNPIAFDQSFAHMVATTSLYAFDQTADDQTADEQDQNSTNTVASSGLYAFNSTSKTYGLVANIRELTYALVYSKEQKLIVHTGIVKGNTTEITVFTYLIQKNIYLSRGTFTKELLTESFLRPSISPDLNYYFLMAGLPTLQVIFIGKWISYTEKNTTIDVKMPKEVSRFLTRGYFAPMVTETFLVMQQTYTMELNRYMFYFVLNQDQAKLIDTHILPSKGNSTNQSSGSFQLSQDQTRFMKTTSYQTLTYFTFKQDGTQSIITKTSFTQDDILIRFNSQQTTYYGTSQLYPRSVVMNYNPQTRISTIGVYYIDLSTGNQKNMSGPIQGQWRVLALTKQTITCVMAYEPQFKLVFLARNNFITAQINQLVNITQLYVQSNASNSSLFNTASDCAAFSIDKNIFFINTSTFTYAKATIPSTWNPIEFDESFKYGIGQDGNLGVYNPANNSYSVVNVQGLNTTLLASYNSTKYLQIYSFQNKILLYTKFDQRPANISVHLITTSNGTYTLQKSFILKRPIQNEDLLISFTLDLNRVVILGMDLSSSKGTGKGFYFDGSGIAQDIVASPQLVNLLSNNQLGIQTTDSHLYVRTLAKNNTDTSPQFQSIYKYQGKHMIKLGQRPMSKQSSMAWQKTILVASNSSQNTLVYSNQYNYNGVISLYRQAFTKPFVFPNTIDTAVFPLAALTLKATHSFKWISLFYDPILQITGIKGQSLTQNLTNYKKSKIELFDQLFQGQYSLLGGTQQSQDCIAVYNPKTLQVFLYQLTKVGTTNTVKLFENVTPYFLLHYLMIFRTTGKNTTTIPKVDVAKACAGFTIDNSIYRYNSSVKAFLNTSLPAGFKWRSLDQSYNYAEGSTSQNNSVILNYKSANNSYQKMQVDTTKQVFYDNETQLDISSLNLTFSWTYFTPQVPNVLLVQYDTNDRKSLCIFKIIGNTNLSLIELLSIKDKNSRIFRSDLLTKISIGIRNSSGYVAKIRSYNYNLTQNNKISTKIPLPSQVSTSPLDLHFYLSETHMYINDFTNGGRPASADRLQFFYKFVNSSSTQFLLKDKVVLAPGVTYNKAIIAKVSPTEEVQMVLLSEMIYENTASVTWYQVPTLSFQSQNEIDPELEEGTLSEGGTIYLCIANCISCSRSACSKCAKKFYLTSNNECQPCLIAGCSSCDNAFSCKQCLQGYFLQSATKCSPCNSNCVSCDTKATNCTSCKIGQYLNQSTNICDSCSQNCISCESSQDCANCRAGFTVKNSSCVQCLPGCSKCDPTVRTTCLSCIQKFYLSGTTCKDCPQNCLNCTSSSVCSVCASGYRLNSSICIKDCKFPCLTCTTSQSCLSCFGGYLLNQTKKTCQVDLSCNSDLSCKGCPLSYVLFEDSSCQLCETIANCSQCSQVDTSLCATCKSGFYLLAGLCKACPISCTQCDSTNVCSACSTGFYLNSQASGSCLACVSPCKTCKSTSDSCLSCVNNYTLQGFKCIKDDRTEFQIRLAGELAGFFGNMDQVKLEIMELIKRNDTSAFTYTKISSGSVVVQGSVATDANGTDSQKALQQAITKGSSVGGYSVQSAKFTSSSSNDDNQDDDQSSSKVGIIVGVILGIIALVIIVVLIVYYCKNKKQQKNTGKNSSTGQKKKRKYQASQKSDSISSQSTPNIGSRSNLKQNETQMFQIKYPYKAPVSNNNQTKNSPYNPNIQKSGNNRIVEDEDDLIQDDLISDYVNSADQLQKEDKKNNKRPYL